MRIYWKNMYFNLGRFRGEDLVFFEFVVGHVFHPLQGGMSIFRIKIEKFIIELGVD